MRKCGPVQELIFRELIAIQVKIISANHHWDYVLFGLGLAVLFTLGTWQLIRGLEKAEIESASAQPSISPQLVERAPARWSDLNYQQVTLEGQWLNEQTFLMDNRLYRGQVGYEVLVPFKLAGDGTIVLVNRGWIDSQTSEQIPIPQQSDSGHISPNGQLYQPQKGFTLGQTFAGQISWPLVILYYDFKALSDALEAELAPVVVVLDSKHRDSLVRIWQPSTIPASRHYGYAVQWWGLALTLLVFGLIWRRKLKG